jgi:hypothetical protein
MTIIPTSQSDIAEVRDQLTVDYADGKYLNVVSSNLGMQRPPFGFSDATWRALVRVLALQYKQITTKFEAVLSIILGPKITQCGAFAEDVLAGAKHAVLVDTEQFPQVGTMVIDEGLASEETVDYIFIDRYSNTVFFETPLVNNHTGVLQTWESGVISDVAMGASYLNVYDATGFPDPSTPYTICIGRGTPYEFAGPIVDLVLDARKLGVSFPPEGASGASSVAGIQIVQDGGPSQENVYYLTMLETEALQLESGWLQSNDLSETFTATAGSTTSVTVAGPLSTSRYGGFWVRFDGNVTAGLENQVGYVEDNTSTVMTFSNTLPFAPAAGDTFVVLANFQYIRVVEDDRAVLMKRELPDLIQFPADCEFSVMRPTTTVAIAQVQVKGTGWDVFQSDPRHVEILLPTEFLENNLRSASYIRETGLSGSTTANAIRVIGDTDISLTDATALPLIGVLDHTAGSNRYAYYNPHAWITEDALAGAVELKVTDTTQFFSTGTLDVAGAFTVAYSVVDNTTLSVAPLPADARITDLVRDAFRVRIPKPILADIAVLDAISFYANYDSGDIWSVDDVWPGPYVWDLFAEIHKNETTPGNTATETFAGPTVLAVDRLFNASVFELEDASSFPTTVPYNVLLGENSGNVETLAVQQLSLRSRTYEVTTAQVNPGDTSVVLTSLSGPVAPANQFPDGGPYRVLIEPFTANQEVLEVIGTSGGTTLLLDQPATITHLIGSQVVLLADLIRVSPAAADDHVGKIRYTDRFGIYAPESQTAGADEVRPLYTELTLALGGTDFSAVAAEAVWNFGSGRLPASGRIDGAIVAGAGSVVLDDTSDFPTTGYPYVVYLDVGAGPLKEERLHVTNNNPGTNTLTFSHVTVFGHDDARLVEFRPGAAEVISYTSRTGAVLDFTPYLVIENTHYEMELLAPSVGTGYPRDNGFDFPLRLPVTVEDRVRFMIDLVRAAGVEVTFVSKR